MIDYDPHDWWSHFLDIRGSMVKEIALRVLAVSVWSAVVVILHAQQVIVSHPTGIHGLVGVAIGLLLVFRTNASYDRFWEGRKQWGAIVNETRNLIRASRIHLAGDAELLDRLARWTCAFAWSTMHTLRGTRGLGPAAGSLSADETSQVLGAQHPTLAVASRLSDCLAEARGRGYVSDYWHVALDRNVQLLVDYLGACERILKTPLPFAYVVHLRRALILYCATLPMAVVETFGWSTPLVTFLVAYTFFGIEEIGVEIEAPFGRDANDLPLEDICATIESNVMALSATGGVAALPAANPGPAAEARRLDS